MPGSLFNIEKLDVLALESVEIESRFFVFVFFLSQFQVVISRTAGCFVVVFLGTCALPGLCSDANGSM